MINRPMVNDNDELLQVVVVKNTHKILGIAIEGGADTKHRLPRIINIDVTANFPFNYQLN